MSISGLGNQNISPNILDRKRVEDMLLGHVGRRNWQEAVVVLKNPQYRDLITSEFAHRLLLPLWKEKNSYLNEKKYASEPKVYFDCRDELEKIYFGNRFGLPCNIL